MGFYPVFLKLDALPCTVVGGGAVAARKVAGLLAAGAVVDVIAPQLHPTLAALRDGGQIRWRAGRFPEEDPGRPYLVIAATDDAAINRALSEHCRSQGIPINVVDEPALCTFILPAVDGSDHCPVLVELK